MCGRLVCNQSCETYQKAACYYDEITREFVKPKWKDVQNNGLEFKPSCNIAPTEVTPVLLSENMLNNATAERVLHPMVWGLIPPWHKGTYKSHGLSTNNCRIENIGSSKLYGPLLKDGKRCIVICDGFYEWQTTQKVKTKQPYFVYASQDLETEVENQVCWLQADFNNSNGWNGPKLLYMAGLYNVWQNSEGSDIFSYTVITTESKKNFSWLHHRVPLILSSDHQIQSWINSKDINMYDALKVVEPVEDNPLSWHMVSTLVNKSTNKSSECNKKFQIKSVSKCLDVNPLKFVYCDDTMALINVLKLAMQTKSSRSQRNSYNIEHSAADIANIFLKLLKKNTLLTSWLNHGTSSNKRSINCDIEDPQKKLKK